MIDDDLYSTAVHEAGHAVLAELFSLNPVHVTIEPTETTLGHLRQRGQGFTAHGTWRNLLVLAAGCVAQGIHALDPSEFLDMPDEDENTDSARLWASLQAHSNDDGQQLEWFNLAISQTQRILYSRPVGRSIDSLADALMEKRTLDYIEAAEVIEAALGRSKWNQGYGRIQMGDRCASPPQSWIESREEYREFEKVVAAERVREAKR